MKEFWLKMYRKTAIHLRGLPVITISYAPWRKGKNVTMRSAYLFKDDKTLADLTRQMAEHIRATYQDELRRMLK